MKEVVEFVINATVLILILVFGLGFLIAKCVYGG